MTLLPNRSILSINLFGVMLLWLLPHGAQSQDIPLIPDSVVRVLEAELSGESAKRNLEYITRLHRMRGSAEFKRAVDFIGDKLKTYGLEQIELIRIPADGKSQYGSQKSRLAWEAEFAELWELEKSGTGWKPKIRLADWESMPITLAEDSESGEATGALIDIGAGTTEKDYAEKNIKGKLVLTSSSPAAVVPWAVEKYGAAGIISYTQNQPSAWWKEDQNLIRWGHLDSWSKTNTFCFMISLKQAADFKQRLASGEEIMLHAKVKAGKHPGSYDFVTAVIRGTDALLKEEEIAFTCHLDHQRPGANDNASGSMTILEVARSFAKLIAEGKLDRPRRTLRFIWSPEIEGTGALLSQRPEFAGRIKADIHMDMVGGNQATKSIFHVAGPAQSLPSFVSYVGQAFGKYVNKESDAYASGYPYHYSFASPEGGKEPLLAVLGEFHMGSDQDVYSEGGYGIPSIYMHDWPDRYIHTNFDLPANIDPTKLKRAGFIGAASGYFIANLRETNVSDLWVLLQQQALLQTAAAIERGRQLSPAENLNLLSQTFVYERNVFNSILSFAPIPPAIKSASDQFFTTLESLPSRSPKTVNKTTPTPGDNVVYKRNPDVKGPLSAFASDYIAEHYGKEKEASLRLLRYEGIWGSEYSYETLNFVNGTRTVLEIRNAVAAEFGPIPIDIVAEYLTALESIGVVQKVTAKSK